MPTSALVLALGAAFLHAFWNLILARAPDIEAATAVALVAGVVAFAPVAALAWDAERRVVPFLVVTSLLQLLYFVLLAAAYGRAELSFVYPIARGSAPVLVLLVGVVVLGDSASAAEGFGGVLLVAAGVLLVRGIGGHARASDLALALAVAGCIAAYTLIDKRGIEYASPVVYQELSMILPAAGFLGAHARSPRPSCGAERDRAAGDRRRALHVRRVHPRARGPFPRPRGAGGRGPRDERRHRDGARRADPS